MKKPIYIFGSSIITQKTEFVNEYSEEVIQIMEDLKDSLYEGVGLSANQIGYNQSILIVKHPNAKTGTILINPEIIEQAPEISGEIEGCLSIPFTRVLIYRPTWVKVKYKNHLFEDCEEKFLPWFSRVVQHEMDHLNGLLMIDRFAGWLKVISEGNLKLDYEYKIEKSNILKLN